MSALQTENTTSALETIASPETIATAPETVEKLVGFAQFGFMGPILKALTELKFQDPTPIQEQAILPILAGRDLLGTASTGTGKTAAYALPIIQSLLKRNSSRAPKRKALVLVPTRELAQQVHESFSHFAKYTAIRAIPIFGGVSYYHQRTALKRNPDVIIATPGRLVDLINQNVIRLEQIEHFVLDEADRMLDMGFSDDINFIIKLLPETKQTLMFSATLPEDIRRLMNKILREPAIISVAPQSEVPSKIDQEIYFVAEAKKFLLLKQLLTETKEMGKTLVFTKTKRQADDLARQLEENGVRSRAIHGDKSQRDRQRIIMGFKQGHVRILVASDVLARGLDVDNITHVINYDFPDQAETYIHRIGRTGRANASGKAITFCENGQRHQLRIVERAMGCRIPQITDHPYHVPMEEKDARRGGGGGRRFRSGPPPRRSIRRGPTPRDAEGGMPAAAARAGSSHAGPSHTGGGPSHGGPAHGGSSRPGPSRPGPGPHSGFSRGRSGGGGARREVATQ